MNEVGFKDDPNLAILIPIAQALGDLRDSVVFVGGCATGLLLTTQRAQTFRATQDVDVVVQATSTTDYHKAERALEAHGFKHDVSEDAPICRWTWHGLVLDLMPSASGILGFHNRWYPLAVQTAMEVSLPGGTPIRLIPAPVFIASKFEAFYGRGQADYLASHDLEDLITVIDGRKELIQEVENCEPALRQYLAENMRRLLAEEDFIMALPGHLPGDSASQARLPELLRHMRQISAL